SKHRVERHRHDADVDRERQGQAAVLPYHQLRTANRLRQQRVDAAALHFLGHQADADEDGDEEPEQRGRREAEVLDDLDVLPGGQLAEQIRAPDQQHREQHQVVEHLVAYRLAEDVERNRCRGLHRRAAAFGSSSPRSADATAGVVTCSTKKSSSVWRIGLSDTRCAPPAVSSPSRRSGGGSSGRSSMNRPSPSRTVRRTRGPSAAIVASPAPATTSSQPLARKGCISVRRPEATRRPFARIATRLHSASASLRTCELKKTVHPRSRSRRISARTSRRPSGSSPDIGSSKITSSGSLTSAWAMPTRCSIPLENFRSCSRRSAPMPTSSSRRLARARHSPAG